MAPANGHDLPALRVEKLLWRGRGLARLESGQVVMLEPGVLPGEIVDARVIKASKDFLQAEAVRVTEPSPMRGVHPCPHAALCGGSRFGMVSPETGLALKTDILRDALSRALGRSHGAELPEIGVVPSPRGWRYRWRGQIHVRGGRPHAMAHASNDLVPLTDCHLLAAPLAAAMPALAAGLPDGRFTIAASPDTGQAATERDTLLLPFSFPDYGLTLELPPSTFFQANWELNRVLVRTAVDELEGFDRIADLFSGAGNFALPLASRGRKVLAVEGSAEAVDTGVRNAERLGLASVRFRAANLSKPAPWKTVRDFAPRAAILDPPRTGAKGVGQTLAGIASLRRLVWVSCDVVNTIRDARPLLDAGWRLSSLRLFDMFPGTWHMEVLMVLDRP
ncbi:class I SAM-dependent RNA methyltransferase [Desulfomicrobium escambiense]|uniref:class I SAM-dependent RNA methyltransferase n=1 Tax=Desulfomicrobium escambiense TaxID=29503 RepID=UPI00041AC3C3|nr:TRAM domain-containing protein [Desulfomicrobium escambiense]